MKNKFALVMAVVVGLVLISTICFSFEFMLAGCVSAGAALIAFAMAPMIAAQLENF